MKEAIKERMTQIYWLQKQLTYRLPDLAKSSHSTRIKTVLAARTLNAREQVSRLEKAFYLLDSRVEEQGTIDLEAILQKFTADMNANGEVQTEQAVLQAGAKLVDYKLETYSFLIAVSKDLGFHQVNRIFNGALKAEKTSIPAAMKIRRFVRLKKDLAGTV